MLSLLPDQGVGSLPHPRPRGETDRGAPSSGSREIGNGAGEECPRPACHTRLTMGGHRDRRPGHSPDCTVCRADRPHHPLAGSGPGKPPEVTGAELVCLAVAQVLLRYDDERHWLRAAPRRVGHLFPRLLGQAEYNQRVKAAAPLMEAALRWLADQTPGSAEML